MSYTYIVPVAGKNSHGNASIRYLPTISTIPTAQKVLRHLQVYNFSIEVVHFVHTSQLYVISYQLVILILLLGVLLFQNTLFVPFPYSTNFVFFFGKYLSDYSPSFSRCTCQDHAPLLCRSLSYRREVKAAIPIKCRWGDMVGP